MEQHFGLICPSAVGAKFDLYFPTNLTILSAALKEAGYGASILDLNLAAARDQQRFFENPVERSLQTIKEAQESFDYFGITTLCATYPLILQLAEALKKEYNKPIILGGPQASMTAQRTMALFPFIDVIVAHEGEITLIELMEAFDGSRDFDDVKGIFYRGKGSVVETPFRPFIEDLDQSPFPDFAAINIEAYRDIYSQVRIPVDIGRGCPFECTFCSTAMMWKRTCRMKSPKRAIAEMDELCSQFGVNYFFLTQDNLTTKRNYIFELCDRLADRPYTWDCYSRCDTLDAEMLDAMMRAGCQHIFFGVESASEKYQKLIKKNLKLKDIENSVNLCIGRGASFTTSYIIGFPEESMEDVELTLAACLRDAARNPRQVKLNVLAPIPGTELSREYRDRLVSPLAFQPDASPFLLKNESANRAKQLIEAYPDVFSSFYFIQATHFTLEELYDIRCFYGLLIDEFPRVTHLILTYSSVKPLELMAHFRKRGVPIRPEDMTEDVMLDYFKSLIERVSSQLADKIMLIEELLKYEHAVYKVRRTPTPEHLFESQKHADAVGGKELLLALSPAAVRATFAIDIDKTLEDLATENHICKPLDVPYSILFYEDAINGDIVIEAIDGDVEKILGNLDADMINKADHAVLHGLIEKGLLILDPSCYSTSSGQRSA